MNHRQNLNNLIQKFEVAEATKSKELRIMLTDVHKYHLALTKLLLENADLLEANIDLALDKARENAKKFDTSEIVADGGDFKS